MVCVGMCMVCVGMCGCVPACSSGDLRRLVYMIYYVHIKDRGECGLAQYYQY